MAIRIRFGDAADVDAAISVYERSNLARRRGAWPKRVARLERAGAQLHNPASWFVLAEDGAAPVGMAAAEPSRADDGAGPVVPGACFLNLLFVVPERWGEGIGGVLLDAVLAEATRGATRGSTSGRTRTTSVRGVFTAAAASSRPAGPWTAPASGRASSARRRDHEDGRRDHDQRGIEHEQEQPRSDLADLP